MYNLDVILKVAEVCNINCTYCYFFNGPDRSFETHPRFLSPTLAEETVRYVSEAIESGQVANARIILHGGEPLMLGKRRFREICATLSGLPRSVPAGLAVQTNAMLIDSEWIDIFEEFRISVGVSIDGPAHYHDEHRVDHRGRGTYERTAAGVELLAQAARRGRLGGAGALCVINPDRDGKAIYDHIAHDLGLRTIGFILPDGDWDSQSQEGVRRAGDYLCAVLDAWLADDDPTIDVRLFNDIIRFVLYSAKGHNIPAPEVVVGVSTNGAIGPDDAYRTTHPEIFESKNVRLNIKDSTFGEYLDFYYRGILGGVLLTPNDCSDCRWLRHCGGGEGAHRHSRPDGFARPSVYCAALKRVYSRLETFCRDGGVPAARLDAAFASLAA